MEEKVKKLYRSSEDRIFAGVLGGLGVYFGVDATLFRLGWIVFVILTGVIPGVLMYLLAILIVPLEPERPTAPPREDGAPSGASSH